jgi:hypothetical protein
MVSSLNRAFSWLVTGALLTWSHMFLVMKGNPGMMTMNPGRNLVSYEDYVQSFSSIRNQSVTGRNEIQQANEPKYRRSETLPDWMKGTHCPEMHFFHHWGVCLTMLFCLRRLL